MTQAIISKVESGIPLPLPNSRKGRSQYPFAKMDVGDSFLVEGVSRASVASRAGQFGISNDKKFSTRDESADGGVKKVRVWRVA